MPNVSQKIEDFFGKAKLMSIEHKYRFCALVSSRITPEYARFCKEENLVDEKLIWNIVYKLSTAFPSNADVMEASKNISLSVPDCEVYPGRDCVFAQNAAFCALNFCEYAEHFDDICLKNCLANLVDTVDYFIQDLMSISKIRLDIDDAILEADVFRSEVDEEFERYFNVVANTSAFHQMILHNLNGQSVVDRWSQPLSS